MTNAQERALKWLHNRGGEGMFTHSQVLLARGELAGVMRATWNALRDGGLVQINKKRVALTVAGTASASVLTVREAATVEDDE